MTIFNYEDALKSIKIGIEESTDDKTKETTKIINRMINACWDSKGLSESDIDNFNGLMKIKSNRRIFCDCMNSYKKNGIVTMTATASKYILGLFKNFMNSVKTDKDIYSARYAIILSANYYYEQKNTEGGIDHIYIQQLLGNYEYFHDESLWMAIIDKPLEDNETEEKSEIKEENPTKITKEIYNRLGTYAHNMLQFEMTKKDVERIILKYAETKGLPKHYINSLQVNS